MSEQQIKVPDIGDFDEVAVIEVMVKPGDTVKVEQSLITVESDKASMEIPSSSAGVVEELLVKVGDKVKKGTPLARVKASGDSAPASAAAAPTVAHSAQARERVTNRSERPQLEEHRHFGAARSLHGRGGRERLG